MYWYLPPTIEFLSGLATGLRQRYSEMLCDITIILPTKRSCRHFSAHFFKTSATSSALLPKLLAINDVDEQELWLGADPDLLLQLDPPFSASEQLAAIVLLLSRHRPDLSTSTLLPIALSLNQFLSLMAREQISFEEISVRLQYELYGPWQNLSSWLEILISKWPEYLAYNKRSDRYQYQANLAIAQAEKWRDEVISNPVLFAGSTGSTALSRKIMRIIASLPNGGVILPDYDHATITNGSVPYLTHPQVGYINLLEQQELQADQILPWIEGTIPETRVEINQMFVESPAAIHGSSSSIAYAELATTKEEAELIALIVAEAVNMLQDKDVKSIAVVSNDENLISQLQLLLTRYQILADSSRGIKLLEYPLPRGYLLLLELLVQPSASHLWLDLLNHSCLKLPFDKEGDGYQKLIQLMVKTNWNPNWSKASATLHSWQNDITEEVYNWFSNLVDRISQASAYASNSLSLSKWVKLHLELGEEIFVNTQSQAAEQWLSVLADLLNHSTSSELSLDANNYQEWLLAITDSQVVRNAHSGTTSNGHYVCLLSPLEARLLNFDLIILSGLNEGDWPPTPKSNIWLGHEMARELNLPTKEHEIARSTLDFYRALHNPKVICTRATKTCSGVSDPSRLWLRLVNTLPEAKLPTYYQRWLQSLIKKQAKSYTPPEPCPPLELRPRKLSVTQLETLLSDPYQIYARYVLRLVPIEIGLNSKSLRWYGTIAHQLLEHITANTDVTNDEISALVIKTLEQEPIPGELKAEWHPRLLELLLWWQSFWQTCKPQAPFVASEVRGRWNIEEFDFVLEGIADHLCFLQDGTLIITDFKTGTLPSNQEIMAGFASQMPLLGLIAANGGFGADWHKYTELEMRYIKLATRDRSKVLSLAETSELLDSTYAGLKRCISYYNQPNAVYPSNPFGTKKYPNAYCHLARLAEWI